MRARFYIQAHDLLAMREFIDADDDRTYRGLQHCLVEVEEIPAFPGHELTLVATNGKIMAAYKPPFEQTDDGPLNPGKYLIPLRNFDVILWEGKKALKDNYHILVEIDQEQVRMSLPERGLSMVRKVSQNPAPGLDSFPDWRAVVPAEEKYKPAPYIAFDAKYIDRIARAARLAGAFNIIPQLRFTLTDGGLPEGQIEIRIGGWDGFTAYLMPCRVTIP